MNIRKKICLTLFLTLTMIIFLCIASCSSSIALDEAVVGKWKLIDANPNDFDDRATVYLTITSDGKVSMEFVLPDEYHEYLNSINFDPEALRVGGTCAMGKNGENTLKITMQSGSGESESQIIPDIHFFHGDSDIIYAVEDDILTLTIQFEDRIYTEVYQKTGTPSLGRPRKNRHRSAA